MTDKKPNVKIKVPNLRKLQGSITYNGETVNLRLLTDKEIADTVRTVTDKEIADALKKHDFGPSGTITTMDN